MSSSVISTNTIGSLVAAFGWVWMKKSYARNSRNCNSPSRRAHRAERNTARTISRLTVRGDHFHFMRSQPVADDQIRRPVARMLVTSVAEHFDLSGLHRACLRNGGRLTELLIDLGNQSRSGLIVDEPQRSQRAARSSLDRDARQPQRGAIVARGGLTSAQDQQLDGLAAILAGTDQRLQIVQRQFAIIGKDERL